MFIFPGIANFFGTILPWRFGVLSAAACIKEANSIMEQYYTSPYRSAKERDVDDHWENPLGIVVPYNRGFTFFIKMDALIRDASNGRASLDDVALDLLNQRRSHQIVRQKEWIASVARFLDEELVVRALNDMLEGEIVIPTTITIPGYELHRCDKELLELGFATESLVTRIIAGVVPGSRAAIAGVQNGDKILSSTRLILIFDDFYSCMELELQRGNQKIDVRYWPRASLKVPCWEFRPIESLC
jgi:predicted metalloprotease with PDZ domain